MKKILVVLTGGTIGSKVELNVIDISRVSPYRLLYTYEKRYGNDIEFETAQPLNLLSEDMTPRHWTVLMEYLLKVDYSRYEGVVITHGTDTLSYTSALLGFVCRHTPIPIVLVGSNYALGEPESNGLYNFRNAVCFIKEQRMKGVFVIYRNNIGENEIHLATRLIAADNYQDQFTSYGGKAFGRMVEEKAVWDRAAYQPTLEHVNAERKALFQETIQFDNSVLLIEPHPGLDYRSIDLGHPPKAILHGLYHSSTACTSPGEYSIVEFIRRCKQKEIDFYIYFVKSKEGKRYATCQEILDSSAIPLYSISTEAAYVKLMIAYNQEIYQREEFMKAPIYFESLNPSAV